MITEYATEVIPPDGYLSPEWYEARRSTISASEIAAVLGLSPWTSPFDLWWAKRTGEDSQAENAAMTRGKRCEPLILEDFQAAHPEFTVTRCGLVVNDERPWQAATPDALAYDLCILDEDDRPEGEPLAVVEAKTDADASAWGEEGTDEIPVKYRCQVLWQMDTLGLNVAYVPMWLCVNYREYVVEFHEADVMLMRAEAEKFLESVRANKQPDIDGHIATGRRLKKLHPELVDDEVPVPLTVVRQYQNARRLEKAAKERMRLAENRIRALIGPASHAVVEIEPGTTKRFSHTISDLPERTQVVSAHTRNQINFPRKDV